ncbi:putative membrane protein [Bacillus cereus]|nr:putative membrane protein [Bacillus cereus]
MHKYYKRYIRSFVLICGGMFGIYIFYFDKISEYVGDFSQPMDSILKAIIVATSICLVGFGIKTFSVGE